MVKSAILLFWKKTPDFVMLNSNLRHHQIAGSSLEPSLPSRGGNTLNGRVNSSGYGKNVKDWIIRSQVPNRIFNTGRWDAVQRLDVGGSER